MPRRGRLIAIEGRSAAGKTTLVRAAASQLRWQPLAEAFDRLDPAPSLEFASPRELLLLEGTLLAEEVRRYREAREMCVRGDTVLVDTGFFGPLLYTRGLVELGRAPESAGRAVLRSTLSLLRRGALRMPDLTIYLETTASARVSHLRADTLHHPFGLARRHEAVGAVEQRFFEEAFPAVLPDRFRTLPSRPGPLGLVPTLKALVADAEPTPASRAEGIALLSLFSLPVREGRRPDGGPNR
jgi:thymidylate kinase